MIEKYLHPYSDKWPEKYNIEAKLIKQALGSLILEIEHIGSTAIPGISAKPIIDIAVLTNSIINTNIFTEALEKIGYSYKPDMSSVERIFLRKGNPIEYHLSISENKYPYWNRQKLFRDFLRNHEDYRKEYQTIKENCIRNLSKDDLNDISKSNEYNKQKAPFIQKVLELAENESI